MLSLTFSLFLLFLSLFLLSHLFHSLGLKFKLVLFSLFLYRPATHHSSLPLSIPSISLSLSSLSLSLPSLSFFPLCVALCLSHSLSPCLSIFLFLLSLPLLSLYLSVLSPLALISSVHNTEATLSSEHGRRVGDLPKGAKGGLISVNLL